MLTQRIDAMWLEPGNRIKVTLLPAMVPFLLLGLTGVRSGFIWIPMVLLAAAWVGFVMWRGWEVMRKASDRG